jgi:hypothetical protein
MSAPFLQTRTMSSTSGGMFARHPTVASRDLDEARQALSSAYLPMEFPGASASVSVDMLLNVIKVGRVTAGISTTLPGAAVRHHPLLAGPPRQTAPTRTGTA